VAVSVSARQETYAQKPIFETAVEVKALAAMLSVAPEPGFETVVEIEAAVEVKAAICRGRYRSVEAAVDCQG
jgi:hypothetical protein